MDEVTPETVTFMREGISQVPLNSLSDDKKECPICYYDYESDERSPPENAARINACGHIIGFECLEKHIRMDAPSHNKCPICRTTLFVCPSNAPISLAMLLDLTADEVDAFSRRSTELGQQFVQLELQDREELHRLLDREAVRSVAHAEVAHQVRDFLAGNEALRLGTLTQDGIMRAQISGAAEHAEERRTLDVEAGAAATTTPEEAARQLEEVRRQVRRFIRSGSFVSPTAPAEDAGRSI